ncbi:hypothetical protein JCM19037_3497 [Geomicrobium sp. JCM 19037]|uniref:deoxyribodipyrimidine photo-lyase n=1 Tax=Geomicrobium sp. JCM 19037 TaxID=1460634 RepID=UPI00045F2153|nr:deoxyribodipyrimidine photo-lyase [Geomicrobium sp. JCM 19037]GAK05033.1 hypothetical protein JCM19037_3497 [Geomicrobium sp. JCM 19037]
MSVNVVWFRRDLRWTDHTALAHVLDDTEPADSILALFIIDPNMTSSFSRVMIIFTKHCNRLLKQGIS